MNVLYGLYHPDAGEIVLDGQPVRFESPRDAIARGIGMVHQHFMLVPTLTVAENVVLGREPTRGGRLDLDARLRRGGGHLPSASASSSIRDARVDTLTRGLAAEGGDRQGAAPRRQGAHPRRAHRRAHAPGGRGAVPRRRAAQGPGAHGGLHQPQAARGAQRRRPHRRHAPRQARGRGEGGGDHRRASWPPHGGRGAPARRGGALPPAHGRRGAAAKT